MNTLLAFVAVNLLIWAGFAIHRAVDPPPNPIIDRYGRILTTELIRQIYPKLTAPEVDDMLHEMWSRPVEFEPFIQFRERPFSGKFVNVHEAGFRHVRNQGPWPPDPARTNIFLFGGSTTFGYGVPDSDTIASQLQDALNSTSGTVVSVYNFGTNSFYSSQERAYFEKLASEGQVPDIAIFLDGLNEFFYKDNVPKYTAQISDMLDVAVDQKKPRSAAVTLAASLPLTRALSLLAPPARDPLPPIKENPNELTREEIDYFDDDEVLDRVFATYFTNKRLIEAAAEKLGVRVLFVWQPLPAYRYDLRQNPFGNEAKRMYSTFGYPRMEQMVSGGTVGGNFLWAADIQEPLKEPLYVDKVHYTARLSGMVAELIARRLRDAVLPDLRK
jgi:hypothetical protein